jgi:esterase/lipase
MLLSNYIILIISICSVTYIILLILQTYISNKNTKKTFDRLNTIFTNSVPLYKELRIYEESIPRFRYGNNKNEKVILLISGYRDVPNMWYNYIKYLDKNNIPYYAPRTVGNGRNFFQKNIKWEDWVLTYFEAILFLSKIYKKINIIGFSTGCNIGVYLLGHDWSNINNFDKNTVFGNLILLSPNFEVNEKHAIYKKILQNRFVYRFLNFFYPIADKPTYKKKCDIDLKFTKNIHKIFYEKSIFLESLHELWKFSDILQPSIKIDNITIFYGDSDNVVGNFKIQKKKLMNVYHRNIKSYKLSNCGHNLINEHPITRQSLFTKIDEILNNN